MTMRLGYLQIGLALGYALSSLGYANVPVARYLESPTENTAVLTVIPKEELRGDAPKFDLESDNGTVVQIFCSESWALPSFLVLLDRKNGGIFTVSTVTYDLDLLPKPPSPEERKKLEKSTVEFEAPLAVRFIAVLNKELIKTTARESKLVPIDGTSYQYWYKAGVHKLLSGKTTSMVPENSRLGRLNRLSLQLRQLALASDWERLGILNAIDRSISEIELSYDLQ